MSSDPTSSTIIERRGDQAFPVLNADQMATARRFGGKPKQFKPGEVVYGVGELGASAYLVLEGSINVVRHDGFSEDSLITTHKPGQISGEISQLTGGATLGLGKAGPEGCTAVPFDATQLRALLIGSAELGELLMRAYILRRMALFETHAGVVLLSTAGSPDSLPLQNFLRRNAFPYNVIDPHENAEAAQLLDRLGVLESELPVALCPDGTLMRRPTEAQLARCIGLLPELNPERVFDVAIVGAGPAGLAAAVYAASEGLSVLVLDERAFGGQAGASARIENYLGFPTGISGQALMARAFTQAEKFGAVMAIPARVTQLKCKDVGTDKPAMQLQLHDNQSVRASSIVVATGARYRRPDLPDLSTYEGHGIYYWASPIEAKLCAGEEVILVGGGNSAGQAVAYLAAQSAKVHLVVRAKSLEASMSRYLIDRLDALPNLELHTECELSRLMGENGRLQAVCWRDRRTGQEEKRAIRHVFLFIGADPNAAWLADCAIEIDAKGFVKTGLDLLKEKDGQRIPAPLETSRRGVFAVGDVRAASVKRVASAVGEGAAVVAQLHAYLAGIH